jgi:hypothetical protein
MKKPAIVITLATLYLLFFKVSPLIGLPDEAMIAMFILAPFIVIYMVYVVLKYGKPSKFTFEEKFYEDHDYKRNE